MIILSVTSVSIFVPLKNQIELQKPYSGVDHQLPHSSSEPGPSTSYSEIRSSIFEYLRKLIRNARRSINSKIEGAKMIRTLLGSSIYEIDTQI